MPDIEPRSDVNTRLRSTDPTAHCGSCGFFRSQSGGKRLFARKFRKPSLAFLATYPRLSPRERGFFALRPPRVWMAPICKSFFVMSSGRLQSRVRPFGAVTRPLALMDSADRGLISWSGLEPTEAVRFLSICRMTDCAITYIYSCKLAARRNSTGHAATAACR
jgi:hypothetical protein